MLMLCSVVAKEKYYGISYPSVKYLVLKCFRVKKAIVFT